jgi:tetratricopeptide (TPR) repeat protein
MLQKKEINQIIRKAYEALKSGQFQAGIGMLQKVLEIDSEKPEIKEALECAYYWQERKEKTEKMDNYSQSEYLMNEWNLFLKYISTLPHLAAPCFYNLKHYVYNLALENYSQLSDSKESLDFESLFRIGRIHKELGNYESAIEILEYSLQLKRNDPQVLADLADCYAQVDEMKAAKLFFREAFFIDPLAIDISTIESPFIHTLVEKIKEGNKNVQELKLWIPIYGTIYGIFNVKRELKPIEIGKLKQAISILENRWNEKKEEQNSILPLLLNKYFWLMDHLLNTKASQTDIEKLLLKIKDLDENIYWKYVN